MLNALPPRPLLVSARAELVEAASDVALALGTELDVADGAAAARRLWPAAPVVLVGADAVASCAALALPRRPSVVVVAEDLDEPLVWQDAVAVGAERVVDDAAALEWLRAALAETGDGAGPLAPVVAVLGGRGGAGASLLASALAVTAGRAGHRVLLLDGDAHGGGLDLVFGAEAAPGVRWPALAATRGRLAAAALARALPIVAPGVALLAWDRTSGADVPEAAATSVLAAGRRGHSLVVADVGRGLDPTGGAALAAATTALVVVPAEVRAAAAATRVAAVAATACADVRLVVRGPSPGGLRGAQVAASLGLPLAGELGWDDRVVHDAERGEAPGRRARSAHAVLATRLLVELGLDSARAAAA